MLRIRVIGLAKPAWTFSMPQSELALCCRLTKPQTLVTPFFALPPLTVRTMHLTRTTSVFTADETKPGFITRIYRKIGLPDTGKYKRKLLGYQLYEDVTSQINFTNYCEDFKLPDTFYSWFVIMELHVWMLMVRYMAEGKPGHEIRNSMVEAMWVDVNKRKSKLKQANITALKKQMDDLSQQFNAAIIGYDEGILSDDKVLAAAIWRRFFQSECNNPEHLEQLVIYIRKQINELDRTPSEELLQRKTTQWLDYRKP